MKTNRAAVLLAERAADQWGLVTAAQAAADGIDAVTLTRLTASGMLHRLAQGVYQLAGATDVQHLEEKVAWLRLAPGRLVYDRKPLDADGGVLSHRSAALIHGIGDLVASSVEITVPVRRQTRDRAITFHRRQLTEADITRSHGLLPVTTIECTIADLTAENLDGGHIGDLIGDAMARGALNVKNLARRLTPYRPSYGVVGDGRELIDYLLQQAGRRPLERTTVPPELALALMGAGAAFLAAINEHGAPDLAQSIAPEAAKLAQAAIGAAKIRDDSIRPILDAIRSAIPRIDITALTALRQAMAPGLAQTIASERLLAGSVKPDAAPDAATDGSSVKESA